MASSEPSAVDMRRTKLKPEEAALIAGEIVKPSWASRNEGIHERVSFEDTLWGFEMAGGAFYKTPLRVVYVKPGSRAEQACIRIGDKVLRIQGIDTSTLTLQEAHELVQEAGINLQIAVTSPDDLEDAHYVYQDPLMQSPGLTPEQLRALERERIQKAIANAVRSSDLQWPWVRRKFIIYRESNCFMVPSKYENKHKDQFPDLPAQKIAYFFPTEELSKVKPKSKQDKDKNVKLEENIVNKEAETKAENVPKQQEHEVEHISEEEEEIEVNDSQDFQREDSIERLQEKIIPDEGGSPDQEDLVDDFKEEESLEHEENENQHIDDSIRKDSDQGSSNYELDSNNNHVNNKNKENDDYSEEEAAELDDKIINELADNDHELIMREDMPKSDDEIINSVLSDNETENER